MKAKTTFCGMIALSPRRGNGVRLSSTLPIASRSTRSPDCGRKAETLHPLPVGEEGNCHPVLPGNQLRISFRGGRFHGWAVFGGQKQLKSGANRVNAKMALTFSLNKLTKSVTSLTKSLTSLTNLVTFLTKSVTSLTKSLISLIKSVTKLTNWLISFAKSVTSLTKSVTSLTKSATDLTNWVAFLTNLATDLVNKMVKNRQLAVLTHCRRIETGQPPRHEGTKLETNFTSGGGAAENRSRLERWVRMVTILPAPDGAEERL